MNGSAAFSVSAVGVGVAAATLASCFAQTGAETTARATLLLGLPGALALALLALLCAAVGQSRALFSGRGLLSRCVCVLFGLWFAAELLQTVWQAQLVCGQQFASMALLGLLPVLLWMGWKLDAAALNHTARVLWWLLLFGAVVCAAGLGGQMRWQRLVPETPLPLREQGLPALPVYAEYFALPLLCPRKAQRRGALLPLGSFLLQSGFALGLELLFGPMQGSGYTGYELLRAWTLGVLSRMDAFLLLLWLTAALYRICFLCCTLRALWQRLRPAPQPQEGRC